MKKPTANYNALLDWHRRASPRTVPADLVLDALTPLAKSLDDLAHRVQQLERSAAHAHGEKPS